MKFTLASLASLLAVATAEDVQTQSWLPRVLFKDVVVIGGGAGGAHAAFKLKEDYGKSVVLIEKKDILGGHVDSFTDKATGKHYNYGVQSWVDIGDAKDIFRRLEVPVSAPGRVPTTMIYADFTTGKELESYVPPAAANSSAAMAKYREITEQYEHYIQPGYFNFPQPRDIPEDLLMPFHQFVAKYKIEAAVPTIYRITGLGVGDIKNEITLYVIQSFGPDMARTMTGDQDSYVPTSGRNQDIYDAFAAKIGKENILYSSTVVSSWRTNYAVFVTVRDNKGQLTIITARKLVVGIQPYESNTAPLNLDAEERSVFSQFHQMRIYAGILESDSLPVNFSISNFPSRAQPANYLEYQEASYTARLDYIGQDKYFRVMVIGRPDLTERETQDMVQRDVDRLVKTGLAAKPKQTKLKWVAFEDHGPCSSAVSAEALRDGFIQKQYALQGRRSTYWTGGAWSQQFQTVIWAYNDKLLPKIVASLAMSEKEYASLTDFDMTEWQAPEE